MSRLSIYLIFYVISCAFIAAIANARRADVWQAAPISLRKRVPQADVVTTATAAGAVSSDVASSSIAINTAPQVASSAVASASASGSDPLAGEPTSSSYGNSIYPGSATFVTPTGSASVSPMYRINSMENVTFIWSFESVLVHPVSLTLAAVGPNSATYTITVMEGGATSAEWHLSDIPTGTPLMNGYYEVQLYDQRGISASEQPGWLSPQTSLSIAFYSEETYANWSSTPGSNGCPYCFYDTGFSLHHAVGPLCTAIGIAVVSSVFIVYQILA
ncbi:hypothetical protein BCR43DRAFT_563455 [Syncephalastrum racemosum]|uniref:DUF7137 domain-containing protein n=1 Tax=Syncephalastrum racemosum TaxID=13706 RepID=A0A1X2HGR3_SYNRA|nr:hypothetical protein BCR43DRAFT_563455 [Syncephalastrum racemosum]